MNQNEECVYCGNSSKPKVIKGVEVCKSCGVEWEPYEMYDDDFGYDA